MLKLSTIGQIDWVVILIVLVILSAAVGYLASSSRTITSTITTTASVTTTTKTLVLNYTDGLEFSMSLNSSAVSKKNDDLSVSLNLFNTLELSNNVTGASNWRLTNQSEEWLGHWNCAQNDVFRIEVLQGYYNLSNYANGTALDIFNLQYLAGVNGTNICLYFIRGSAPPMFLTYSENYYVFEPQSNEAQLIALGFRQANQRVTMNESILVRPSLFTNSTGIYTIVGGDEWGDVEIAHFSVIP